MKFRFRRIGPIREAELEPGDLTILAGRNNTGKTYLAYSLYGFLKSWRGWPEADSLLDDDPKAETVVDRRALRKMAAELAQVGEARRAVDRETLADERSSVVSAVARSFSRERLASVFSSPPEDFVEARLEVVFDGSFPEVVPRQEISFGREHGWSVEYDGAEVVVRTGGSEKARTDLSRVLSLLHFRLLLSELPAPFTLSAERFGISLFYRELDFTRNQLVDVLQQLRDGKESDRLSPYLFIDKTTSRYAFPIKENIDFTRGIAALKKERSEIHDEKLFAEIRRMMDGYFTATEDDIRFVSRRRKDAHFNIALHRASSSARALSDFWFFLRHVARRGQLLIVDEPESHLDTRNQIEVARLLSKLVRVGVRVLITTHSDYIVKEINNLLMLHHLPPAERVRPDLGIGSDISLEPERVRAYVAENGGATPCSMDRYGISMPNFEKPIDETNRRSWELAERVRPDASTEAT